MTTKLA